MNPAKLKNIDAPGFAHHFIEANGIRIHCTTAGSGKPILLLHGWPFTWYVWNKVIPALAMSYFVIAPDLRGIGASDRPEFGYDLDTKAADAKSVLDFFNIGQADIVGHDLGTEIAFMLAMRYPEKVSRLVLMEAVLAGLPGAEEFLAHSPWWFGFHDVPGLAECVIEGNEDSYLDWFYTAHSYSGQGIDQAARDEFVTAYRGEAALRGGFAHYRAFKENTNLIKTLQNKNLNVPTMALGGNVVGGVLYRQLMNICSDLTGHIVPECGHHIPLERPDALLAYLREFL